MTKTHPSEEEFERYLLGNLGEVRQSRLEEHLLLCGSCQSRLREIDSFVKTMREGLSRLYAPVDFVHDTEDGPIRFRAIQTAQGWEATFRGSEIQGAARFESLPEATEFLINSMAEMFPGHRCNERCGSKPE